ncbi:MAG TPA: ABC transporter ATP-binding protein [Thermoplasmata archaeon]|nr:ABC transporter ATP-binding protein [Thermoplasmata archaeon]
MTPSWAIERLEADLDRFHLGPVDLHVAPGQAVAVLGASGAGKTTLLRALAGFLPVRRGRVLRDGVDVTDWPPEARSLGYVPQGLGLFPNRSVEGNIRYPMEIRDDPDARARTSALVERFGLAEVARRPPARLSGGEMQRTALARALAADPQLIVWDEPWQGLDVLARHELGLVLHDLKEDERVPVVVVTHDPSLAFSVADAFLVLDGGQMRTWGGATELLTAPRDAFTARFVGYDNVFDRAALEGGGPGSLGGWLAERAGPAGVAFATPEHPAPLGADPLWEGRVRTVRPSPSGLTLGIETGPLLVSVRWTVPTPGTLPVAGDRVQFWIDPGSVHPLGGARSAAPA